MSQRRFKAATGIAPTDSGQRLRVRAARRRLEDESSSVQKVMTAVGYDDVAVFGTLFRRHTGLAPSDYKKRFGEARA